MALAPDSTLHDGYRITAVADSKPDGSVYRAVDREGRRVLVAALPQLDADELQATAALCQHLTALAIDGLLPLKDHFAEGNIYYLVCDDPGGQDLDRYVREWGGPMPEAHVLTQMERLLLTLEGLHTYKPPLYLGDLRGSDLWSDTGRNLLLTPFPLARPVSEQDYGYRAPELTRASEEPNAASDMYSFGVLFYQMLTGWMPPTGAQREAGTPLNAPRTLNGQISALAEQAVLRSLELKQANRYQAAHEMRQALKTVHIMAGRSLGMEGPLPDNSYNQPQPAAAPNVPPPPAPAPNPGYAAPAPVPAPPAYPPQGGYPPQPAGYPPPPYGPQGAAPAYAQPYPAQMQPQRRGNTCLIVTVVVLAIVALLVTVALVFVLLGPGRTLFGGASALAPTASLAATSASSDGAAAAPTAPAPQAAGPAAITVASAATLTETQSLAEDAAGPVLFSPDGKLIAVGLGKNVVLRDAASLEVQRTLFGHSGNLNTLAFAPDNSVLASGAIDDNTIRLWNVATGQSLRQIEGHGGWIRTLAFSPDGRVLASGSTDKTIRLWDAVSGQQLRVLEGHTDYVSHVAFSPDGKTLASTSRDGTLRLWDVASGVQKPELNFTAPANPNPNFTSPAGSPHWMTGLAFSPDGTLLAAGSTDRNVRIWSVATNTLERTLEGHTDWVMPNTLAFAPDGKTLASSGLDGTVRLWDPATGAERGKLESNLQILALAFEPDGAKLATTSALGGSMVLWDLGTQETQTVRLSQGIVTSLAYSNNGEFLATSGINGMMRIHVLPQDRSVTFFGAAGASQALAFINPNQLAAISDNGAVMLIDLAQQGQTRQLEGLNAPALSVVTSPDGSTVAAGNAQGQIALWDAQSGQSLRVVDAQKSDIRSLAFSSDGRFLAASASGDQPEIAVIDVSSGERKGLSGHAGPIVALAFRPNSSVLLSSGADRTLRLWDVASGQQIQSLQVPEEQGLVTSIALSPDGTVMATGSLDGTVTVWDAAQVEIITSLRNEGIGSVLALAFRPDGQQIAASLRDGSVRLLGVRGS